MGAQADGFGSDSVRLIRQLQKDNANLQILLFSATFDERVRIFAQKVAGPDANQVILSCPEDTLMDFPCESNGNAPTLDSCLAYEHQSSGFPLTCSH